MNNPETGSIKRKRSDDSLAVESQDPKHKRTGLDAIRSRDRVGETSGTSDSPPISDFSRHIFEQTPSVEVDPIGQYEKRYKTEIELTEQGERRYIAYTSVKGQDEDNKKYSYETEVDLDGQSVTIMNANKKRPLNDTSTGGDFAYDLELGPSYGRPMKLYDIVYNQMRDVLQKFSPLEKVDQFDLEIVRVTQITNDQTKKVISEIELQDPDEIINADHPAYRSLVEQNPFGKMVVSMLEQRFPTKQIDYIQIEKGDGNVGMAMHFILKNESGMGIEEE